MNIQITDEKATSILYGTKYGYSQELIKDGSENLLFSGAKGYYLGGGWWRISGYSSNDVSDVINKLN